MTTYVLPLTLSELDALEFARGRYAWPGELIRCLTGTDVVMSESEAWEWSSDVELDMAGGHRPYPLADRDFAVKLEEFRMRIV